MATIQTNGILFPDSSLMSSGLTIRAFNNLNASGGISAGGSVFLYTNVVTGQQGNAFIVVKETWYRTTSIGACAHQLFIDTSPDNASWTQRVYTYSYGTELGGRISGSATDGAFAMTVTAGSIVYYRIRVYSNSTASQYYLNATTWST